MYLENAYIGIVRSVSHVIEPSNYGILGPLPTDSLFYQSFPNLSYYLPSLAPSLFPPRLPKLQNQKRMHATRNMLNKGSPCTPLPIRTHFVSHRVLPSNHRREKPPFLFRVAILSGSVKKDAGNGPGSVRRKIGGLCQGPLVPLCTQTEPMNFRREEVVQDEHDRFRTTL